METILSVTGLVLVLLLGLVILPTAIRSGMRTPEMVSVPRQLALHSRVEKP